MRVVLYVLEPVYVVMYYLLHMYPCVLVYITASVHA